MSQVIVGVLTMFLAFFVYLLMAGAGIRRAVDVMARGALMGVGVAGIMALLPSLVSTTIGEYVFVQFAVLGCFVGLAMMSLSRAREFVVPKSSTLEVVCLNVLIVAFAGPPDTFAFFEMFMDLGYFLLVNPLAHWVPADLGWLKLILQLWPSALALWAASRGEQASRWLRLFLMWWVQLACITWIFPASINVLFRLGDGTQYHYFDALLAAVGMVRVVLSLLTIHTSLWGSRSVEEFAPDEAAGSSAVYRQTLAGSMSVYALPGWAYAAAGIATYLLVNVTQHFFAPQVAITDGFFMILGVTAVGTWLRAGTPAMRNLAFAPLVGVALLATGLLILNRLPLLPRYVPVAGPPVASKMSTSVQPPAAAAPPAEAPAAVPPVPHLPMQLTALPISDPQHCMLEGSDVVRVRCGTESWPLAALAHLSGSRVPAPDEVGSPARAYRMRFVDFDARCIEIPVLSPDSETGSELLLVFLSDAALPGQVGWVRRAGATCGYLGVASFADEPPGLPTVLFVKPDMPWKGSWRDMKVFTVQRFPLEEAPLPQPVAIPASTEKLESGAQGDTPP